MSSDPRIERALEEFFESERLSRRGFIGRAGSSGLALTGLAAVLAACGGVQGEAEKAGGDKASTKAVSHPKTEIGNWTFANWPLYIDKKVLKDFNKQFGGKVKYTEEINDNFEFFGKVRQQLQQKQPIGRDIVTLTDYMAARWVRLGYTEPIDKKNVPNFTNLVDNLKTINYDPKREYTLPWQSGATSIGYNIKKTGARAQERQGPVRPEVQGQGHDALRALRLGLDGAARRRRRRVEGRRSTSCSARSRRSTRPTRRASSASSPATTTPSALAKGDIWVALAYSGDMVQLQSDNPDLRFAYFEEGNVLFTDNMMMPAKVEHPYAAETMMNYVYEPEVAATHRGVRQLHLAGQGRQGGHGEAGPEARREPADLPARRRRGEAAPVPGAVAEGRADDAGGHGEGHRGLARCCGCRCADDDSCSPGSSSGRDCCG